MAEQIPEPPAEAIAVLDQAERRDHVRNFLLVVASLGMGLGLVGAAVALGSRDDAVERANKTSTEVATVKSQAAAAGVQAKLAADAVREANRRLKAAGKPTVVVPTITAAPTLPSEVATDAEVRQVVTQALRGYRPSLTPSQVDQIARVVTTMIPKPTNGKAPTQAQLQPLIQVAVASYCGEDRCVGKSGDKGDTGERGPEVSDERLRTQIGLSLTAYCTQPSKPCRGLSVQARIDPGDHGTTVTLTYSDGTLVGSFTVLDGEKGDKGDKGDDGPQGPPGPTCGHGTAQQLTVQSGPLPTDTATIYACVITPE